jgi:Peptidase family M23
MNWSLSSRRTARGLALTTLLALAWANGAQAAGGPAAPSAGAKPEPSVGVSHLTGPAVLTDNLNRVNLSLPAGWYALVPLVGRGSTTFANYDLERVETWMPEHSSHVLLTEMAKVDVAALDLAPGQTLEGWVAARRAEISSGLLNPDGSRDAAYPVSDAAYVRLGQRDGLAWAVQADIASAAEVAFSWGPGKVLLATVMPADTQHLAKALDLVGQLRRPAESLGGAVAPAEPVAMLLASLHAELPPAAVRAGECSLWTGSDAGTAAGNTTLTLNLPFQWQTWWEAGGAGAFWGNLFHGNCTDDYYAIDFNRRNTTCNGYLEDAGQNVYAAANGTAFTFTSTTGYGNRVDVVHGTTGYKTRYAHLQSISVGNNVAVTTQTVLGLVGTTGNSGGPHLHFGFYQSNVSRCNVSPRCPNNELPKASQTRKPSPMNTNVGSRTIFDGGCFQAPP